MHKLWLAVALALALVSCKARSPGSDSAVKDIDTISSGGMNSFGQKTFVVQCAEGWVHVINGQQTKKVTITEEEFNQGNVTKRYCTTAVAANPPPNGGGGGNPPPPPPGGGGQGLGSIAKGFYTKLSGPAPCKVVTFNPVLQLGVLKRVEFACANSAFNGNYICADNLSCKKGNDTLSYFDDHFELEVGGQISSFSINAAVLPGFAITMIAASSCSGASSQNYVIQGQKIQDYEIAGVHTYCEALTAPCNGGLYAFKIDNGGCNDIEPNIECQNNDQAASKKACREFVAPKIKAAFDAWANSP